MVELAFAAYLVLIAPAQQLYRSLAPDKSPKPMPKPLMSMYLETIRWLACLLASLFAVMLISGRSATDLGLTIPLSVAGWWGLALSTVLMCVPFVWTWIQKLRGNEAVHREKTLMEVKEAGFAPTTRHELVVFVALSLLVGIGWELLYRGFLMLVLSPVTGTAGAVVLATLAYGLGHGYENPRQLAGSVLSAFLFTLGYVFTGSLWWLMLLHVAAPLYIGFLGYAMRRELVAAPACDAA